MGGIGVGGMGGMGGIGIGSGDSVGVDDGVSVGVDVGVGVFVVGHGRVVRGTALQHVGRVGRAVGAPQRPRRLPLLRRERLLYGSQRCA